MQRQLAEIIIDEGKIKILFEPYNKQSREYVKNFDTQKTIFITKKIRKIKAAKNVHERILMIELKEFNKNLSDSKLPNSN